MSAELAERGSEKYLEHVEAALCLAYTALSLVIMAGRVGESRDEVAERAIAIVNDLAPLVGAIIQRVQNEATAENLQDELQGLDRAGLGGIAERVWYLIEMRQRSRRGGA